MRDIKGRFQPGGVGGPGRPAKSRELQYANAIHEAITVGDVIAVFKKVAAAAKSGDLTAAKLILSYTCGLPCDTVIEARIAELERLYGQN